MTLGVNEIRIPISGVIFPGSAVAGLLGIIPATYSEYGATKGHIEKAQVIYSTASGTGSIFLYISGTDELVFQNLGSANNIKYPRRFVDTNAVASVGSPNVLEPYISNGPLYVVGSSLGSPSNVYLNVWYTQP